VHTDLVETENVLDAGGVHVGIQFFKRLGMEDMLREAGLSERSVALACAMLMNRLLSSARAQNILRRRNACVVPQRWTLGKRPRHQGKTRSAPPG
jgi:hypothetical protein